MEDIEKFKHVLEYFVAHLSYVNSGNVQSTGFAQYIKPLIENHSFNKVGQGWKGHAIQNQIKDWERYGRHQLYINVTASYGNYKTRGTYLNWKDTGINIAADWDGESLTGLCILHYIEDPVDWIDKRKHYSLDELGLFDDGKYTEQLNDFYDFYFNMIEKYTKEKELSGYVGLLLNNHNLILTGAPGTGKTYLAKRIAEYLGAEGDRIGFVQFHPSYDYTDFIEGLRPVEKNGDIVFERRNGVFKEFCKNAIEQPSSKIALEEAVKMLEWYKDNHISQLIKSIRANKDVVFEVRDNRICAVATTGNVYDVSDSRIVRYIQTQEYNPRHETYAPTVGQFILDNYPNKVEKTPVDENAKYVFVIDEINRGEISKIFGELFYSIDPGYRGVDGRVKTQYQNLVEDDDVFFDGFYVPGNVYIIGTMNDIDRSVESMDFAFRRRFAFKEISSEESMAMLDSEEAWDKVGNGNAQKPDDKCIDDIKHRMTRLNDAIWHTTKDGNDGGIEGLSAAYHIGASYFLKLVNYRNEDGTLDFDQLWHNHLEGLLREYMRGMPGIEENIEKLKTAYSNEPDSNSRQ